MNMTEFIKTIIGGILLGASVTTLHFEHKWEGFVFMFALLILIDLRK